MVLLIHLSDIYFLGRDVIFSVFRTVLKISWINQKCIFIISHVVIPKIKLIKGVRYINGEMS